MLDPSVPQQKGLEALQRLSEVDSTVPVIVYSACPCYQELPGYVLKSSDLAPLKKAIARCLETRE